MLLRQYRPPQSFPAANPFSIESYAQQMAIHDTTAHFRQLATVLGTFGLSTALLGRQRA
jgi:hypothetical protein